MKRYNIPMRKSPTASRARQSKALIRKDIIKVKNAIKKIVKR